MNKDLVRVENLSKYYQLGGQKLLVLDHLNFTMKQGEKVCIQGASGSGKSTFLHLLGSLDRPSQGHVFFESRALFQMNEKDLAHFRNQNLGFVFQFHHLLPEFSAFENVMMPALVGGFKQSDFHHRVSNILEFVGLKDRMNHRPGELSGGEQQRVAIARALIMGPSLILADEPTGNLDVANAQKIFELFNRIYESKKTSILYVTHDESLAKYAHRVFHLEKGQLGLVSPEGRG